MLLTRIGRRARREQLRRDLAAAAHDECDRGAAGERTERVVGEPQLIHALGVAAALEHVVVELIAVDILLNPVA